MSNSTPHADKEFQKFGVALDNFPEFSAQLGVLISCFALIEDYMHRVISYSTNMDEQEAFFVSGSFSGFGARITLLETLIKNKDAMLKEVIAAKYFVKTFKEASIIRNDYAHGKYSLTFEGATKEKTMIIKSFLYDAKRREPKIMRKNLKEIKEDVQRLKFIICELHAYIYRDEMPNSTE